MRLKLFILNLIRVTSSSPTEKLYCGNFVEYLFTQYIKRQDLFSSTEAPYLYAKLTKLSITLVGMSITKIQECLRYIRINSITEDSN